jgi:hypothetical protein
MLLVMRLKEASKISLHHLSGWRGGASVEIVSVLRFKTRAFHMQIKSLIQQFVIHFRDVICFPLFGKEAIALKLE